MLAVVTLSVLLGGVSAYLLLSRLIPELCRGFLVQPNFRSSHTLPTPTGGGTAFVLSSAFASALTLVSGLYSSTSFVLIALPLVALPLAVIGLFDDLFDMPPAWRYVVQLFTVMVLMFFSSLPSSCLVVLLLIIPATAVINFSNFMDGLDGLVSGCMTVAISALSIKLSAPWPIWVLVGSLLGFLVFNWSPSKVFMGDVGSTFLGAVFVGMVLMASSWLEALCLLLVATPLLGDACFCVIRRLLAGQSVFQAHRLHLYQRLHQAGWSHARVSSIFIAATGLLALALLIDGSHFVIPLALAEIAFGVWLDQRFALPFLVASRS